MKEFLAVVKTTLGATDREVVDARATKAATRIELAGELIFFASFVGLILS